VSSDGSDDATRFGTQAFYASLGRAFVVMCGVVPFLALVVLADLQLGGRVNAIAGIRPHQLSGLDGIVLAPFVHDGWDHLLANSTPLILLGTFALAGGTRRFLGATLLIAILSGLGVWSLTPSGYLVVGASGIIFGWLGFLLMRSLVERSLWNFAVVVIVGLLYGWQVQLLFPTEQRISWQGHLFGFFGGLAAAIVFRRPRVPTESPPALLEASPSAATPAAAPAVTRIPEVEPPR
jgi:membrane associated rhomboid family serine protease